MDTTSPCNYFGRMTPLYLLIKKRRLALGLSMEGLAEKVGVSWQTIQQWEKAPDLGGTSPRRGRFKALAESLEMPMEDLLLGVDPENKKQADHPEQKKAPATERAFFRTSC